MKPPIPYFGGKIMLGPQIAQMLPAHRHYVEPYCGSLAVLLAKPLAPMETVNDLDQALITFWRVLRDRPDDLARVCDLTPHSRAERAAAFDLEVEDDVEVARRVWVQLTQSRSAQRRSTGWRHVVTPSTAPMTTYLRGYVERIIPAAERLRTVSLECMPALKLIAKYGAEPEVLLYVDPPYLGTTRTSGGYRHEMTGEADHRDLAAALRAARSAVVLSGYASPLYDLELYPDWHRHTMPAGTGQGDGWGNRVEVLWSNRPLGAQYTLFNTGGAV